MLRYYGYAAKTVSQWTLSHCITMLPKHTTHSKLFWIWIVSTRQAFWDYCQQNWIILSCLTPVESKNWPLTFSSITMKRYVVDRSNSFKLYFFWIVISRGICWYGFWQHWSNFSIWPLYKLSCDLQASCTGCDLAAIWNGNPWTHTNIMKLSNFLFLFSWVNFGSVRPISVKVVGQFTKYTYE